MSAPHPSAVESVSLGGRLARPRARGAGFSISILVHLLFLIFLARFYRTITSPTSSRQAIVVQAKLFVPPQAEKPKQAPQPPAPLTAPAKLPRSILREQTSSAAAPVSADQVQLDRESLELVDPAGQVEQVLTAHDGAVAFSVPAQEGRLEHIFRAPDWSSAQMSGFVPAERYCSFTMVPPWAIAVRLASQNGLPRNSLAYVVFERSVCNQIWQMIREAAGQRGIECVKHAKLRFDSANEKLGLSILDLNECDGARVSARR